MPASRGGELKSDGALHRAWAAAVRRTYGDVCWICEHGGARQADHVIPETERPDLALAVSNGRPAHGSKNRCPVCRQHCNQLRGYGSVERARRKISERVPGRGLMPLPPGVPPDEGREWLVPVFSLFQPDSRRSRITASWLAEWCSV